MMKLNTTMKNEITQIFIIRDLNRIIKYFQFYKIKHGPIWKVTDWQHGKGHACAIMNKDAMVLLSLAFDESYRIIEDNEQILSFGDNREIKMLFN